MSKKKKIIWGIVIVIVIAGSIAAWYAYSEFNRKPETAADKETDMKVEAKQIMKEFLADEQSATKKYSDKTIEITGVVEKIQNEKKDNLSVSLETGETDDIGIPLSVKVMLIPDENEKIQKIKVGDKITLKGLFTGMNSDVEFNRGIIL